jgi:hypothetical protein
MCVPRNRGDTKPVKSAELLASASTRFVYSDSKSVMGLQFLAEGARLGQRSVMLS